MKIKFICGSERLKGMERNIIHKKIFFGSIKAFKHIIESCNNHKFMDFIETLYGRGKERDEKWP